MSFRCVAMHWLIIFHPSDLSAGNAILGNGENGLLVDVTLPRHLQVHYLQ